MIFNRYPFGTHWVSQEKKSDTQFLHCVKPTDGNFTEIWDSLPYSIKHPSWALTLNQNPDPPSLHLHIWFIVKFF